MNLTKLARLANVSVSTVSKAFSDSPEISNQTREIIFNVAKEHGCFEKYYKPVYSKKVIAVICPEMLGIHYTHMATFLSEKISSRNGTMMLSIDEFSGERNQELIDYYTKFCKADGIIVIEPSAVIKNNTDIPIVQIGADNEAKNVDCVNVVVNEAMDSAFEYLLNKKYRKIGFIGEKYTYPEYEYFNSTAEKFKVNVLKKHISISNLRFYDAGYYGMEQFIKNKDIPQVIFAAYSHIAVGILQRLKEEKLSVPKDVSIICMDDLSSIPYSDIKLSCIKMHLGEVCDTALDLLYKKIEGNHSNAKLSVNIIREFLVGESLL